MRHLGWMVLTLMAGVAEAEEHTIPFWPEPERVWDDMSQMAQEPMQWDDNGWMWAGAVGLGTIALQQRDGAIRAWVHQHDGATQGGIAKLGNNLGNGLLLVPVIGLSYLGGWVVQDEAMMGDALAAAEAYVGAGIVGGVIKVTAGRARPYVGQGPNHWRGPLQTDSAYQGFPSGHATSVFAVASALATRHPGTWVGPIAYSLAATTLYARLHADVHWGSDVFLGAAIGYWAGTTVGHKSSDPLSWQVLPLPGGGEVQATLHW